MGFRICWYINFLWKENETILKTLACNPKITSTLFILQGQHSQIQDLIFAEILDRF